MAKTGFINAAKIYVRGNDLFTIDNIESVDAASYGAVAPLNRSVIIGAAVTF